MKRGKKKRRSLSLRRTHIAVRQAMIRRDERKMAGRYVWP